MNSSNIVIEFIFNGYVIYNMCTYINYVYVYKINFFIGLCITSQQFSTYSTYIEFLNQLNKVSTNFIPNL